MPVKVGLHDNTSQVHVDVHNETSEVHVMPGSETITDKRLEALLKKEIKDRIAGDEHLQEQIDEIFGKGAWDLAIEEHEDGSIDISLLNKDEEVLCTRTIEVTEKIIKSSVLDYEHSKIIYTCKDDSTIELDISDIVDAITAVASDLASEVARATAAEEALHQEVVDETARATSEETRIETKAENLVADEQARAEAAEQGLDTRIDNEIIDRENADNLLQENIDNEEAARIAGDDALDDKIGDETQARMDADDALDDKIDQEIADRTSEIARVDADILAESNRAKGEEYNLQQNINAEETRATNAEQAITTRIDNLDLATVGQDGSYIKTVGQQNGQLSATKQAFDTDMANATDDNAPTTKNAKDYTGAKFTEENNRAIGEETILGQRIDAEYERASQAENLLDGKIDAEETRATGVENTLSQAITDEASARSSADTTLQNNIDAEALTRGNADTALNNRIDALDLSAVGSDGGYIKTVSQADGQVSATRQSFDTSLTNADDTNAPTSKTVKDYVDAETTRATNAESALGTRIDNLDLAEVGASGSYIKLVSQNDGQVSATSQALDTTIDTNSDDNNAPTSKAVKDYVDSFGGKIDSISINGVNQPIVNKNVDLPAYPTRTSLNIDNVDNTSDLNKPISTATQTALNAKQDEITSSNKLSSDLVDDTGHTHKFATQNQLDQIATNTQDISDLNTALTTHTGDTSNPHSVTATQVGLGSVVNTGDNAVPTQNSTEKFTSGGAYTLKADLETEIGNVDDKLNYNVHIENGDEITYSGDTVTKTSGYRNLKTGTTGSRSETIHLANSTTAGLMSHTDYNQIRDNTDRIAALEGTPVRLIYTASQSPTASDIKTFVDNYLASKGILNPTDSDYNSVSVKVNGTNHIWNYYANDGAYKDEGLDTVTAFTNSVAGIILGSSNDGQVYAENNGTGSVYGWSALKTRVGNNETNITSLQNDKVDKVSGKGLSTNDFTDAYKNQVDANATKLAGIESGAEVNDIVGVQVNGVDLPIDANRKVNIVLPSNLVELTYAQLKTARDGGTLIPGRFYRITDYVTTTAQARTQSASHQFDVIVLADSSNKLNENAYAILHSGDTYFANSKLESWQLKYCLDNDTTRFAWADSTNGKGVIFYMKDEFNNECWYDFKNIQFVRYKVTACTNCPALVDKYVGVKDFNGNALLSSFLTFDDTDGHYYYTFDCCGTDYSLNATGTTLTRSDGSTFTLDQMQCLNCSISLCNLDSATMYLNDVVNIMESSRDCEFKLVDFDCRSSTLLGGSTDIEIKMLNGSLLGPTGNAYIDGYVGQHSSLTAAQGSVVCNNGVAHVTFYAAEVGVLYNDCLVGGNGYMFYNSRVAQIRNSTIKSSVYLAYNSTINYVNLCTITAPYAFFFSDVIFMDSCSGTATSLYCGYSVVNYMYNVTQYVDPNDPSGYYIYDCNIATLRDSTIQEIWTSIVQYLYGSTLRKISSTQFMNCTGITCTQNLGGCKFEGKTNYLNISSSDTSQAISNTSFCAIQGTSSTPKNVVINHDYSTDCPISVYGTPHKEIILD